ncbi:tetratricopeptide repeat protein [Puniceibacterium sp. IMCC21224]|uniref:tetratricopeptide repeat protein n=1 Tax=Puniceibacterium sp. IMCC21224 TaxID=1618204 RepID=UPI00064DC76C|nr:tetratricopeptide repeat protein [Puniceibacterium sp. IMCC21224]KMK68913.1 TPR repeat [Puniceibacterium sp. IMCC21224]
MRHAVPTLLGVVLTLSAMPLLAEGCPPSPDHDAESADLLSQARAAKNEMLGRQISNQMWQLWADAPDEPAQDMLEDGMSARSSYDFLRATQAFDRLVEYCPDYAEGYNQRAFVNFLREDFAAALGDLDAALDRNPQHVAALTGKALTLMGMGRDDEGQKVLRDAVALNPWLSERHLLRSPPGQEL